MGRDLSLFMTTEREGPSLFMACTDLANFMSFYILVVIVGSLTLIMMTAKVPPVHAS